jgi:hypothetical protein
MTAIATFTSHAKDNVAGTHLDKDARRCILLLSEYMLRPPGER